MVASKGEAWGKLLPMVLALQGLFGFLQLADSLNVVIYPTIHRSTSVKQFDLGLSLAIPLAILLVCWILLAARERRWLASTLPLLGLALYPIAGTEFSLALSSLLAAAAGLWSTRRLGEFLLWLMLTLAGLEALSLIHWLLLLPLGLSTPLADIAMAELKIFHLSHSATPLLAITLFFIWFFKPLYRIAAGKEKEPDDEVERSPINKKTVLIVAIAVVLGLFSALYPYLGTVNPLGVDVGVDARIYTTKLIEVNADLMRAFSIDNGTRPTLFLTLNSFQGVLRLDPATAVRYIPTLLNPLLVASVFFLALEATGNAELSAWASFFTACGFQITVGMYAYFLSNLLALIFLFFSIGLLIRSFREGSPACLVASSALGFLVIFTHPWTFVQYIFAVAGALALLYFNSKREVGQLWRHRYLLTYLLVMGASEVVKELAMKRAGGFGASALALEGSLMKPDFWGESIFSFQYLYGGFLSNWLLILLSIVGLYWLGRRSLHEALLYALLAISSFIYLVGDDSIKGRLLFNLPIGLIAALGLYSLSKRGTSKNVRRTLLAYAVLYSLVYLFRSLANLV